MTHMHVTYTNQYKAFHLATAVVSSTFKISKLNLHQKQITIKIVVDRKDPFVADRL